MHRHDGTRQSVENLTFSLEAENAVWHAEEPWARSEERDVAGAK